MIHLLSKPIDALTVDDIKSLIREGVPEGEQVEYKRELPGKINKDPWMSGKDEIGVKAKRTILEETVAFANAYGGALVLGIKESGSNPPVAEDMTHIPRCADLAEQLKHVFRDCVEPELPRVEIRAVPTDDDQGIIVLRTGRSRLAPHRVIPYLTCPIRRSNRCEKMTMREIQDMTLNVARGLERIDRLFAEREALFGNEIQCLSKPIDGFGMRITAMPVVDEIHFDRVFGNHNIVEELRPEWKQVVLEVAGRSRPVAALSELQSNNQWRPKLRAARSERSFSIDQDFVYHEIHRDGLLEFGYASCFECNLRGSALRAFSTDHLVYLFRNLLDWVDKIRIQANAPSVEYAVEFQIQVQANGITALYGKDDRGVVPLCEGTRKFPRYSIGSSNEIPALVSMFYRDLRHFLGLKEVETWDQR